MTERESTFFSRELKATFDSLTSPNEQLKLIAMTLAAGMLSSCANVSSLNSISGSGVTLLSLETGRNGQSASSEIRHLQERAIEGSKSVVFASTINALTDLGFRVTGADGNTGFITASGGGHERISVGFGGLSRNSEVSVVSAFVEERNDGISTIRIVFAKSNLSSSAEGQSGERMVSVAGTYDEFFRHLDREVQSRLDFKSSDKLSQNDDHVTLPKSMEPYVSVTSPYDTPEPSIAIIEVAVPE